MTSSSPASPNNPQLQPPLYGSCTCKEISFTLIDTPIRVQCCHCLDCKSKTGSAFATNVVMEFSNVQITSPNQPTTTEQGPGRYDTRCDTCFTTLWGRIPVLESDFVCVRAGTLDRCQEVVPDVHYFIRSKVDWWTLPDDVKKYEAGTPSGESGFWSEEAKRRLELGLGRKML